jgi:pyruvate dehydrogenase E1 component alpha subunit
MNPRSSDHGQVAGVARQLGRESTLEMFRRICFNRQFELAVSRAYEAKRIRPPIYLSLGQEQIAAALSIGVDRPMIFAQHRAHSYYLSFGGRPRALVDELLGRDSGCAQGRGGSASIHEPAIGMFGHSGFMGDQVPIAVGAALASQRHTLAVMGDASVEEDYVFAAMGFAITKKAPVLFVCEDNDRSILTPVAVRRSWNMTDVARGLGMPAVDITDDPWLIVHHVRALADRLPAFLNVRTCREQWHAGVGSDGPPEWNRFALVRQQVDALGLQAERQAIEDETEASVKGLWQEQLQTP